MSEPGREANVLGALALAVADHSARTVAAASGQSPSAVAALCALHEFLDRPTLDELCRVLGLTPSGAVRLVDRLARAGLVTRTPGDDRRSRAVVLTDEGRRLAAELSATRARTLEGLLNGLSGDERKTLHSLLGRVMANVVEAKDGGAWICRLCDLAACGRAEGHCPAANAAARRYGPVPGAPQPRPAQSARRPPSTVT
ncbi:MAG: MarR family winged helix-turn-helix transcriptional regulator [Frankia sp.]